MITLRQIEKNYSFGPGRELQVLRGLDLDIQAGEILAIRGVSGSGKSTLLHLLGALDRPSRGEIFFRGEAMSAWPEARRAAWRRQEVGFIFQSSTLLPELNLLENVALPGWLTRRDARRQAEELAVTVGLGERLHHRPGELSGGEQQRAAIARALVNDPELLLADEPTGNLDAGNRDAVLNLLLDLARRKKKALVLVTHDEAVAGAAGRVLELVDGKLAERQP